MATVETEEGNDKTDTTTPKQTQQHPNETEEGTNATTPKQNEEEEKKYCDPRIWVFFLCLFFLATIIFPISGAVVSSDSYEFENAPEAQCKTTSIKQWDCRTSTGTRSGGTCSGEGSRYEYSASSHCTRVYQENYCSCGGTPDPPYEGTEWAPCWISDCGEGGFTFVDPHARLRTGKILFIMTAPCGIIMITILFYLICCVAQRDAKQKG
eukprot:373614_1